MPPYVLLSLLLTLTVGVCNVTAASEVLIKAKLSVLDHLEAFLRSINSTAVALDDWAVKNGVDPILEKVILFPIKMPVLFTIVVPSVIVVILLIFVFGGLDGQKHEPKKNYKGDEIQQQQQQEQQSAEKLEQIQSVSTTMTKEEGEDSSKMTKTPGKQVVSTRSDTVENKTPYSLRQRKKAQL